MPLYEYRCEQCGAEEERLESLSAAPTHACPACGHAHGMRRHMSVPSLTTVSTSPAPSSCGPSGCATGTCPFA